MSTEAQKKASKKYDKENSVVKTVKFNKKTDKDILDHIEDKKFVTYVKELIRKDINGKNK